MPLEDASGTRYWVLRTREHWLRSDHLDTALDPERNVVTLGRNVRPRAHEVLVPDAAAMRYGVAWDAQGRIWRAAPSKGRIERVTEGGAVATMPDAALACVCPASVFSLVEPRGIAIDRSQRLYIADAGTGRVSIVDLRGSRLVARLRPPAVPGRDSRLWDIAADASGQGALLLDRGARTVWRILPDRAPIQLLGPGGEWEHAGQESLHDPTAILAGPDGAVLVLDRDPEAGASGVRVVWARRHDIRSAPLPDGADDPTVPDAVSFALDGEGYLLVGGVGTLDGKPAGTLVRYFVEGTEPDDRALELHVSGEVQPWGFDGGALVTDASGDVLFTTPSGLASPAPAYPDYRRTASVFTFALDSGIKGCVWHRAFFEACLPEHTGLRVSTRTSETLGEPLPLSPPQGFGAADMRSETTACGHVAPRDAPDWMPIPRLLRRPAGADRPFYQPGYPDGLALDLYEGLVFSPPGRYLWLELELSGTDRVTPAVAGLRVYYPRPSYLRYLPEIYREDPRAAELLDRLLSLFETFHGELDRVRDALPILFKPEAVPSEALEWLAGWVGMVLDPRWPEAKRRRLLAQARQLYRDRGTLAGLTSFLQIYTDHPFQIVEAFRTRQAGGFVVGADVEQGQSVVGAGLVLHSPTSIVDDPGAYAHRFTVFIAGELGDERAVIEDIIELEKPAHTLGEICDVTASYAVGRALLGISTLVGKSRCFTPAIVGEEGWPVGRQAVLGGRPPEERGVQMGAIRLGRNTVVR